jgi:hypothetical protein
VDLLETLVKTLEFAFVSLNRKGALDRLRLLAEDDAWPVEATAEWIRMEQSLGSLLPSAGSASTVAPAAQAPIAPVVVVETPIEVAARDWKELSGDQFRAKYLNHQGNRKFYEQALEQGLIK